ncbi:MAG: CHASE sensor domain-containing protein [Steroidobacteraceae bacterium]
MAFINSLRLAIMAPLLQLIAAWRKRSDRVVARALHNTPIKRKLIAITMISSGIAILGSSLMFVVTDFRRQHIAMLNDLDSTAAIIGANSVAALSGGNRNAARQILNSLTTRPLIVGAALYDAQGNVFATYRRGDDSAFVVPPVQAEGQTINRQFITLFRGIRYDDVRVGSIYLQWDMVDARARLNYYIIMFLIMMSAATAIALLLGTLLQKTISGPVLQLASIVQKVKTEQDYSLRAVNQGNDELGALIDGFNAMLDQIQIKDGALHEAREHLERRVAERTAELANSLALLNATLESSPDAVMAHRFSGGITCYNTQYVSMWNIPPELLNEGNDPKRIAWIAAQTRTPEKFYAVQPGDIFLRRLEGSELIELKDGRMVERYVRPQRRDGEIIGVVICFRDVTQRIRAEKELETTHRKLLETSRQAGMAEVASNVLHNVGNVLNSVNVSASLLAENIKRSKVTSLTKVSGLLREHGDDIGGFISNDPKGRQLPGFIAQLGEHLLSEQQAYIAELDQLRSNIDHIKEIVTMQQSYSKVSGVKEVLNVVDLMEDALRMNAGALQRHGVEIRREYAAVPSVNAEKHKILQILVNLISNAKGACSDSGRREKHITLRIVHENDCIKLAVSDNGVGISAENMTRIFNHGFTTRKDGHGFGLHSGALAARELGGVLSAASEGAGLGAVFSLELPCAMAPEAACLSA